MRQVMMLVLVGLVVLVAAGCEMEADVDDLEAPVSPTVEDVTPTATPSPTPPAPAEPPPQEPAVEQPPPQPPAQEQVYYANCTEARQAGAAPLGRDDPGYRSALDRDNDGIACE